MSKSKMERKVIACLEKISLKINGQQILSNINFELSEGEITTLIGPNGGGKTSIARIVIGVLKPNSGHYFIHKQIRIGYMPQRLVIDNTIPLRVIDFIKLSSFAKSAISEEEQAKLFSRLNIKNILNKQIKNISGGQLQRVSLARALINNPNLLVLDEPTQYMDIAAQDHFYELINIIRSKRKCAILMISHDLHMVMQKTDNVLCINNHICCHGTPESIHQHPEYLSLFGKKRELMSDNIAFYSHQHNHKHQ